jgi:hypothetical protein
MALMCAACGNRELSRGNAAALISQSVIHLNAPLNHVSVPSGSGCQTLSAGDYDSPNARDIIYRQFQTPREEIDVLIEHKLVDVSWKSLPLSVPIRPPNARGRESTEARRI